MRNVALLLSVAALLSACRNDRDNVNDTAAAGTTPGAAVTPSVGGSDTGAGAMRSDTAGGRSTTGTAGATTGGAAGTTGGAAGTTGDTSGGTAGTTGGATGGTAGKAGTAGTPGAPDNQTQSGVVNSKTGKSTLGPDVKKTRPDQGEPTTSKGDTIKQGGDSVRGNQPPR